MNIFKKYKLYRSYVKTIKEFYPTLKNEFGVSKDWFCKLGKRISIPQDEISEPYNIRTSDINEFSQKYLKNYLNSIQIYLNKIGLNELYELYKINKVGKYDYEVEIGFKLFNTDKMGYLLLFRILPILAITLLCIISYITFISINWQSLFNWFSFTKGSFILLFIIAIILLFRKIKK